MIKILIDSAADISAEEAKNMGVIMLPMQITFGEEEFLDGVTLLPNEFYEKLIESETMPKTSLINQFRWEQAIAEHLGEGDELIIITLSSKLSGTYEAAKKAAEGYHGRVYVVDSLNATVGERLLCQYALRLREEGCSAKNLAEKLEKNKKRIRLMALISTLEYLKKGGRISSAVALAGAVFSIKPVVSVVDGEVKIVGKALGSRNGSNLLNKLIAEKGGIDFTMPFGTIWSGLSKTTLDKYIADSAHIWAESVEQVPTYPLGGTIGTHVGPGAIGVAFFEKE